MSRVEWSQSALNELASVWMQADSAMRQAITAATNALDHQLQNDPEQQGESRNDTERILFTFPLGVGFEIDTQRDTVTIRHVWSFRKRGK